MRQFARILIAVFALLASPFALAGEPININTADATTLSKGLKGIGLKRAEAIVAHRKANGPFKSADDLVAVKGIGKATIEENRPLISVK